MKITEIISSILFLFGLTLKLLQWPGSSALIVLSLTIASFYYFLFGFAVFNGVKLKNIFKKEIYNDLNAFKIVFAILIGLSLSILVNGIMYKLQEWFIQFDLLLLGLVLSSIILILYIIFFKKKVKKIDIPILLRGIIIIIIGLFIYLVF